MEKLLKDGYTAVSVGENLTDKDFEVICKAYEGRNGTYLDGILLDNYKTDTNNITLDELRNCSKSKATFKNEKKKFLKNESYSDGSMTDRGQFMNMYLPETEGKVYKYFNTISSPKDIKITEVLRFVERSVSRNIYSIMAESTRKVNKIVFSLPYKNKTVEYYYIQDKTLSMRDISSFL
jgi:hypothetical protein